MTEVVLQARNSGVADAIDACARGVISFSECCERIAAMGFKTTSVYEMVCAAEAELKRDTDG